ncbi:MAG: hypothetical protein HRO68_05640 [Nitrosopumilus sp.]|nr:hypothetical protein [Nitrosopumilus sp.]
MSDNHHPSNTNTGLKIALFVFWPVMIYLGYKIGKTKFYVVIVIITMGINTGLSTIIPFPYYMIGYVFYIYFAYRLFKELA